MTLLMLGLALWVGGHLFKRLAPGLRAGLGGAGYAVMAVILLAAVVLMVIGYRRAEFIPVWTPLPGIGHLNNLMMLIAIYLFGAGKTRGLLSDRLRHPMLLGTVVFAAAHLLVNGDVASLILFGGLGLWALAEIAAINAAGPWTRPAPGAIKGDLRNLAATLVLYGLIAGVHIWIGHNPFTGTYG